MDLGLQNGDKILAIGGNPVEKFGGNLLRRAVIINDAKSVTVERNGQERKIAIDEKFVDILSRHENKGMQIFVPRRPFVIGEMVDTLPAGKSGLQDGDKVIALNNTPTPFYDDYVKAAKANKGKSVNLSPKNQHEYRRSHCHSVSIVLPKSIKLNPTKETLE